ncbi:MAG TPA: hypothetical protein VE134_00995, partial [Methanomicrobiales archaeon]|nr:hypothetical protein [Methanomicrobiales archaeon]
REFLLYADAIAGYLEGGGVIAWGIVPAEYEILQKETEETLFARLQEIQKQICEYVSPEKFFSQSLVTPTCGIRFADEAGSLSIMGMAAALSRRMRGEDA